MSRQSATWYGLIIITIGAETHVSRFLIHGTALFDRQEIEVQYQSKQLLHNYRLKT